MEAGRELDALVAEKVMGETIWHIYFNRLGILTPADPNGLTYQCQKREQALSYIEDFKKAGLDAVLMRPDPQPYSTDIAVAMKVVEKTGLLEMYVLAKGNHWSKHPDFDKWFILNPGHYESAGECEVIAEGDTAPHAICLAALKAVGHIK